MLKRIYNSAIKTNPTSYPHTRPFHQTSHKTRLHILHPKPISIPVTYMDTFEMQQYLPDRCRTAMYWSDLGLAWDPFYKVEVVGCYVLGRASLVSVKGWDLVGGVLLRMSLFSGGRFGDSIYQIKTRTLYLIKQFLSRKSHNKACAKEIIPRFLKKIILPCTKSRTWLDNENVV